MPGSPLGKVPLSSDLVPHWDALLASWELGLRGKSIAAAELLVDRLVEGDPDQAKQFGRWLCEQLFDTRPSERRRSAHGRALYPLEIFPLSLGVTIPHLGREMAEPTGQTLRWLYQAVVGLGGRLTPDARTQLHNLLEQVCGSGASILDLLRLAAADDDRARQWLAAIEADTHPCGPLWLPFD